MDKEIKVSVIVPVYNTAEYLPKCLNSIINQTLKEIEIICINDGSTDNSLSILENYANKDSRIKVLNQNNSGCGIARNYALKYAKGEYIGFVDSDDWIDPKMYQDMYENAKQFDTDMTFCGVHIINNENNQIENTYLLENNIPASFDDNIFTWEDVDGNIFNIFHVACLKIYKLQFIQETNSYFGEYRKYEDVQFSFNTFLNASRVSIVRKPLYYYVINRIGSIIKSSKPILYFEIFKVIAFLKNLIESKILFSKLKNQLNANIIDWLLRDFNLLSEDYKQEFFNRVKIEFDNIDLDNNPFINSETKQHVLTFKDHYYLYNIYKELSVQHDFEINKFKENYNEIYRQKGLELSTFQNQLLEQSIKYENEISTKDELINKLNIDLQKSKKTITWKIGLVFTWIPWKISHIFRKFQE
jgi:glycosyltransferase involved in cell wall biosynthesis